MENEVHTHGARQHRSIAMMKAAAATLLGSVGLAAAQTLSAGDTLSADDASIAMPVLRSEHPLATAGETVTFQRLSEAGVMIALDKSHCG